MKLQPIHHQIIATPETAPGQVGLIALPDAVNKEFLQESMATVEASADPSICIWCHEKNGWDGEPFEFPCIYCGKNNRSFNRGLRVLFDRTYFPGKKQIGGEVKWLIPKYDIKGWLMSDGRVCATRDRVFFRITKDPTQETRSAGGIIIPGATKITARNASVIYGETISAGDEMMELSGRQFIADIRMAVLMELPIARNKKDGCWYAVKKAEIGLFKRVFQGEVWVNRSIDHRARLIKFKSEEVVHQWFCITGNEYIAAKHMPFSSHKIKPLWDYVLLKLSRKSMSGIMIVTPEQRGYWDVVRVGPGRKADGGAVVAMDVSPEDIVIMPPDFPCLEVEEDGKDFRLVRADSILAVYEE